MRFWSWDCVVALPRFRKPGTSAGYDVTPGTTRYRLRLFFGLFLCNLLHIVRFITCSSSSLRLSEESKEPEESEDSEEIEEDLEDSDDSEMNYIFEIEMDAYRQEASASANPFENSDLEEDLF